MGWQLASRSRIGSFCKLIASLSCARRMRLTMLHKVVVPPLEDPELWDI
jgi:hypothetical protein